MEEAEKTYEQENVIEGEKKDQGVVNAQEMRETKKQRNVIKTQRALKKRRKKNDHLGPKLSFI